MELVLFVSQFIRCGNCFWIGDKGKVSRGGRTLFLILPPLCFFLEEVFNVLFCRTEGVLGEGMGPFSLASLLAQKYRKSGRSRK